MLQNSDSLKQKNIHAQMSSRTINNFQQILKNKLFKQNKLTKKQSFLFLKKIQSNAKQQKIGLQNIHKEHLRQKQLLNLIRELPNTLKYVQNSRSLQYRTTKISSHRVKSTHKYPQNLNQTQKSLEVLASKPGTQQLFAKNKIRLAQDVKKQFQREKSNLLGKDNIRKFRSKKLKTLPSKLVCQGISLLSPINQLKKCFDKQAIKIQGDQQFRASFRYKDIPVAEFIYQDDMDQNKIRPNRSFEQRLQQICRKRVTSDQKNNLQIKTNTCDGI